MYYYVVRKIQCAWEAPENVRWLLEIRKCLKHFPIIYKNNYSYWNNAMDGGTRWLRQKGEIRQSKQRVWQNNSGEVKNIDIL